MRYIQLHHGSYWFQMRVPRTQHAKHGEVVRVNVQTADRDVARVLGTALAARWLARFSQLDLLPSLHPPAAVGDGALVGPALDVERTAVSRCPAQHGVVAAPEPVCDVQGRAQGAEVACRAWLTDDRPALGRAASGTLKACFVLRRNSSSMLSVQWAEDTPSARKSLMTSDTRALSGTHRQA